MGFARFVGRVVIALGAFADPGPATAHPHVWVTVRMQIGVASDGKVIGLIQDWTFDEMYSAFAVRGLAPNGGLATREDFAEMAKTNGSSLATVGFYTVLNIGGKKAEFAKVSDYWMEERPDHRVAFHVAMLLKAPTPPGASFSVAVADPEFFIDFELDDKDPITFIGAPTSCVVGIAKPAPPSPAQAAKLTESFFRNLPAGANFGLDMASKGVVSCP
jgi:ABC-type uncharacterized transport system substrate-binding protein